MFYNNYSGATNTVDRYSLVDTIQTRNSGERVKVVQVIDDTEGFGAMDTLPLNPYSRNLDLGGGQFDTVTNCLLSAYKVDNYVYDPFNRTQEHNYHVLNIIKKKPVDTVTSNSVLNVILKNSEREQHIKLAYQALRKGGTAFFKVWRGNASAVASHNQSNKEALHYFGELCDVFGEQNLYMPQDDIGNTIIAKKM